jgi:hypothetical protein
MPSFTRRDALRAGIGVAAGVSLAGCSAGPELAAFRLGGLSLMNTHEQPHTATVLLVTDDELVYRATMDADPARETEERTAVGGGEFEGYPTEPGRYELYGWHEAAADDEWARLAFDPDSLSTAGGEPPCVEAVLVVVNGRESGAHSYFMRSVGCDAGEAAQSSK